MKIMSNQNDTKKLDEWNFESARKVTNNESQDGSWLPDYWRVFARSKNGVDTAMGLGVDADKALADAHLSVLKKSETIKPIIVCLCGSTRFMDAFQAANLTETIAGKIVLSIGCNTKSDSDLIALGELTEEAKAALDELHKRKIDLADEVLVLNVGGYIGESTRSEIDYAQRHGKTLRFLESEGIGAEALKAIEDAMKAIEDDTPSHSSENTRDQESR